MLRKRTRDHHSWRQLKNAGIEYLELGGQLMQRPGAACRGFSISRDHERFVDLKVCASGVDVVS